MTASFIDMPLASTLLLESAEPPRNILMPPLPVTCASVSLFIATCLVFRVGFANWVAASASLTAIAYPHYITDQGQLSTTSAQFLSQNATSTEYPSQSRR